jgi:hypothetical protein
MPRFTLLVALAILVAPLPANADGKLQRAREEVRGRDSSGGSSSDDDDDDDDDDDHDHGGGIIGGLLEAIFSSDSEPPPREENEPQTVSSLPAWNPTYGYARYPYANGHDGYLVPREIEVAYDGTIVRPLATRPHDYAVQLTLEAGYLDSVARVGPSLRLLTPSRVEVETRFALLHESLEQVAPGEPTSDASSLGASHLSYRLGEGVAGLLRFGIGMRYMVDDLGADAGFDMLVSAELFVGRPFVLTLELTGGTLGEAVVFAPRAQLGVMLGRCELFASYEHLVIGEVELPAPMLGTRIWL